MIAAQEQAGRGEATLSAGRIIVPVRFKAENLGFLRSLPGASWREKQTAWSFMATPATAAKLVERGFLVSDGVKELAASWTVSQTAKGSGQPPRRKTTARLSQEQAYWFAASRPAAMLAVRMGKGKSKVAVDLAVNWGCRKVLVLCPKSVIGVWPREFEKHGPDSYQVLPLDRGSSEVKVKLAAAALAGAETRLTVIVVNYETAIQNAFAAWALKQQWDLVVCDESHRIKQASGKASKVAFELGQRATRRLALTGTPMPHSPLDLYAQFRFLDAGIFGTSFVGFRQRYAVCDQQFASKVNQWINQDDLQAKFRLLAHVDTSLDDLDLPPISHETINVSLSPQALKAYRELEDELVVDLGEKQIATLIGEAVDGEVTTGNALTKILRLQQIASGHVRTDDERVVELDTAKAAALAELLDGLPADEPVCVFCPWRHNLVQVQRVAEALGRTYGEISGERKDLTDHATMPEGIQVMGVQWQSGSVGIDLTRARYGVIYAPTFNGGNFEQGLARQHRPGQTRATFFYHLLAVGTVDHVVYGALRKRGKITEALLNGTPVPA